MARSPNRRCDGMARRRNRRCRPGAQRSCRRRGCWLAPGADVYASDTGTSPELEATAARAARRTAWRWTSAGTTSSGSRARRSSWRVPAFRPTRRRSRRARRRASTIVSEIEIGLRFLPRSRYIAITGTNGKTTTTALIAPPAREPRAASVGGRQHRHAAHELALSPTPPDWVALEVSSFQLHDTPSIDPRGRAC